MHVVFMTRLFHTFYSVFGDRTRHDDFINVNVVVISTTQVILVIGSGTMHICCFIMHEPVWCVNVTNGYSNQRRVGEL